MSVEILNGLIKQVQAAVLNETNFSSYDPDDPSFPDLPSTESSISELDPSPPHLRCRHCSGRLLRGVNSLICVFCGKQRASQDAPPEPISFRTTFGCRWLLDSLGLDGAETVALPVHENELNRGRNATEDVIPLSDLLDLEISWNPEFDMLGTETNQSSFNIAAGSTDDFVDAKKLEDASAVSVDQFLTTETRNGSGNEDFQVRENVYLSGNIQSFETATTTTEDESGMDSFCGWEANFQSAGAGTRDEEPKSIDLVVGSSVDLATQMNEVFGSREVSGKGNEVIIPSGSRSDDWFQDDQLSSPISGMSGQSKQVEVTAAENDGKTMQNTNDSSSMNVDWIQDAQSQSQSNKVSDIKTSVEMDDFFDTLNDFTSSASTELPAGNQTRKAKQVEEAVVVKDGGKVEDTDSSPSRNVNWFQNDSPQTISADKQDNKSTIEESDAFDDWNDFASSTIVQDPYSGQADGTKQFEIIDNVKDEKESENANSSSMNVDWFQDYEWKTDSNKGPDCKTADVTDDFIDDWNGFTSSTSGQDPSRKLTSVNNLFEMTTVEDGGKVETANNSSKTVIQDDQWPNISNDKATDEGDDLFDTWNDFTSSTTARGSTNKQADQTKEFEVDSNVDPRIIEVSDSSFDWFDGDQLQMSSNKVFDGKLFNKDSDASDAWNDFSSPSTAQDPSNDRSVNHETPSFERTSVIKSLATNNNLQNVDCDNFLESHFSGGFSNLNCSSEANILESEPSVSNRIPDVIAKNEVNPGETAEGDNFFGSTKRLTTDDLDILMSQMHDLSFMLASDLSIPPKQR